jgi:hypothetical protein
LFENATTTYDQMHGRFLVLFTVTDTGLTQVSNNQGFVVTSPRKSSWVLMVSRYAILTDATDPVIASSDLFVTPTPPNDAVTGGVNANLWTMFMWGNDPKVSDPTGPGSINSLPAIEPTFSNPFDCLPTAIAAVDTMPTTVCYFPTAARLGVDNETVTIATPVYNANINPVNLDPFFQPVGGGGCLNGQAVCTPGYAGTRIRVIKKSALYTAPPGLGELVAGNQHDPLGFVNASLGQYYDLYSNIANGTPIALAGVPPTPYTAVASAAEPLPGTLPQADPALNRLSGLFYEPAHLRGRTMATYSNSPVSFGNTGSTYLVGTVTGSSIQTAPRATVWVQGIRYSFGFTQLPTGATGTIPFFPVLDFFGGIGNEGFPAPAGVDPFWDPELVPQQNYRTGGPAPSLWVGDSRPHSVIFREGHLYDARVGRPAGAPQSNFPGSLLSSTVFYDIVQKLAPSPFGFPNTVLQAKWQNAQAFAPMYDTPANVVQAGQAVPINLFPFLEKLFVATTFPPLAGQPDTTFASGDPRSRDDSSTGKPQLPGLANCYSYFTQPGGPGTGSGSGNNVPPGATFVVTTATVTRAIVEGGGNVVLTIGAHDIQVGANIQVTGLQVRITNDATVPPTITVVDHGVNGFRTVTAATGTTITVVAPGIGPQTPGTTSYVANSGTVTVINANQSTLSWGSLFDMRCGEDAYDSAFSLRNPYSARLEAPVVTYTIRGAATTDPNDGSLWNFGAYARKRLATIPTGQWGTFVANYKLAVPETDPYNNSPQYYTDVPRDHPGFLFTQIARQVGIVPQDALDNTFEPNKEVTRAEMAYWVVKSQMDEQAITDYLNATGPLFGGANNSSFGDVPGTSPFFRYVEVMYRRGYTKGCFQSGDAIRRYCPDHLTTRREMAVFLVRAKMSNVFPTVLSGCPVGIVNGTSEPGGPLNIPAGILTACGTLGDNFGLFVPGLEYFTDNPLVTGNDNYVYIQKMRELRITNGTSLGPLGNGRNGAYSGGDLAGNPAPGSAGVLNRWQIATFMVRAFFL